MTDSVSYPPPFQVAPPRPHDWLIQDAYSVPKHPAPVDLALNANERTLGEHIHILKEYIESTPIETDEVTRYPSPKTLESAYASFLGINEDQVLLTAGGDEGLSRLFRAFLSSQHTVILPTPTFPMLARFAQWCNASVIEIPWLEGDYPVQAVLNRVTDHTRMVMVVSPNNPTGLTIQKDSFLTLIQELSYQAPHCILVFDGAYIEFSDEDLTPLLLQYANCIVVRTLSKAFGLAGLRMGFLLGHPQLIQDLRAVGLPYPVSGPALHLAHSMLKHQSQYPHSFEAMLDQVRFEREWLIDFFKQIGAKSTASQGNFVFVDQVDALWWRDALAGQGISLRIWPDHPTLKSALRLTCPADLKGFKRLQEALLTAHKPQALLFDVDGVLVDVSRSYRQAVMRTAASFGVEIHEEEIDQYKSRGNANNDWIVTHEMLKERQIEVSFEEVKAEFERLYHGELWQTETLLGGTLDEVHASLTFLSQHWPLALVTGRPRKDLNIFLDRFNLSSFFPVSVCMDDAPAKPHARPVELALERLSVYYQTELKRAWMIGDTPDDVTAARGCGRLDSYALLPFAITPSSSLVEDALWKAGAGRLIPSWQTWLSLLNPESSPLS